MKRKIFITIATTIGTIITGVTIDVLSHYINDRIDPSPIPSAPASAVKDIVNIGGPTYTITGEAFDSKAKQTMESTPVPTLASITLPSEISAGDILTAKPYNPFDENGWINMPDFTWSFYYTSEIGNLYMIDTASGGEITVKIDIWEGRGGYAEGTIAGKFILNDVDKITFENGKFKIPIADRIY